MERGGAERQLIELSRGLVQRGHEVSVCTFYDGGPLRAELEAIQGLHLSSLGKSGRWDIPEFLWNLIRVVRRSKPDIVHSYMGVANEVGLFVARLCGAKVVWGLRASNIDFSHYDVASRIVFEVGARLSRFADAIIVNSCVGRDHHVQQGYSGDRMVVVHNGIDSERFRPDAAARERTREAWRIAPSDRLVGMVARADPKKDHVTFLKAAARVNVETNCNVRFVCVGKIADERKRELAAFARDLNLSSKLVWADARDDVAGVYAALDILVLSSAFGEGFPNVVAEAMAVGRPCVVTRVGDAATIVGDTGVVVPPEDPEALASGILELVQQSDATLAHMGAAARARIVENFSRSKLISETEAVLREVLKSSSLGYAAHTLRQ